ncbi:MAG TPA: argininosuccinate lyase [Candidatus Acidoferrales bacterium]|nr:argininosuccinate lyase [Candidatus Acidoferrales bacterium]
MSASPKEQPSGKLWGGRFDRAPDELFYQFQRSFSFDRRLLPYELAVDRVWAGALESAGILSVEEMRDTLTALDKIAERASSEFAWLGGSPAEDVHHFVETALVEYLGAVGYKLHTGRSRNELVATDFRMFVMESAGEMRAAVARMIAALVGQAEKFLGIPMPGMTHMQHAQPILFSHFLLAHAEAFFRDAQRLNQAEAMADSCPMGSGALAGCALDVDRGAIARELGFARPTANSLDAASDRDFALDYLYALAVIATHLSRLAEDFVLFASQEFGFIVLPDEFSTGSSLMPQKKNPDAWELLRGKTGRVTASLYTLLTTMKGLPSSYQRDLQEDKEPVFAAHDQAIAMLTIAAGAVAATRPNEARMREAASDPALLATEAAHYLVRRGAPFRQAHEIVGQIVREAERAGKPFSQLPVETLQKFSPLFAPDFYDALKLDSALAGPDVEGGTAPSRVRDAIAAAKERLAALEKKP